MLSEFEKHIETLKGYGAMNNSNCNELKEYIFALFLDIEISYKAKKSIPIGRFLGLMYYIGNYSLDIISYFPEKKEAVKNMNKAMVKMLHSMEKRSPSYSEEAVAFRKQLLSKGRASDLSFTEADKDRCLALAAIGETSSRIIIEGLEELAHKAVSADKADCAQTTASLALTLLERPNSEILQADARKSIMQDIIGYTYTPGRDHVTKLL